MYEVKIEGTTIGYVENKKSLNEKIQENVENYSKENIESAELTATPEYELRLVNKSQDENEDEVIIALQNELEITYKYYEIASNNEVIENVKDEETAEKLVNEIKELSNNEVELTINEKTTKNIEEMDTNTLEVAKENIIKKLDIDTTEAISNINGIKIATLPISGTISSRYGAVSSIR